MIADIAPADADAFASSVWKVSQFNSYTPESDGALLVHNSRRGSLFRVSPDERAVVEHVVLHAHAGFPSGVLAELALHELLVPASLDERAMATELHRSREMQTDELELILMPNENCNFRCSYCYESFLRGKMSPDVVAGIKALVRARAAALSKLRIGWFGGEPLTAVEIIRDISADLQDVCRRHGIVYASSMVTNGYLMTPSVADTLFEAEVRQFQITVDGEAENHDRLRILAGGRDRGGTFATIMENVLALHRRDDEFLVVLRVNFDAASAPDSIKRFVRELRVTLLDDPRFMLDFHPVGRWGGKGDGDLDICDTQDGHFLQAEFHDVASESGFDLKPLRQRMQPFGSVCYAANPHSFVIGSDGTVYKCTVAFEDERNQVGRLTSDGLLNLDENKMELWTRSGEERDSTCQACSFRPACQGNACPWARLRSGGERACPSTKTNHTAIVRLLAKETSRWHTPHAGVPSAAVGSELQQGGTDPNG